jgi:hypothetical protein
MPHLQPSPRPRPPVSDHSKDPKVSALRLVNTGTAKSMLTAEAVSSARITCVVAVDKGKSLPSTYSLALADDVVPFSPPVSPILLSLQALLRPRVSEEPINQPKSKRVKSSPSKVLLLLAAPAMMARQPRSLREESSSRSTPRYRTLLALPSPLVMLVGRPHSVGMVRSLPRQSLLRLVGLVVQPTPPSPMDR